MRRSLKSALESSWIILKLVIPIYILADILYFYNTLSYVTFLIEPFTSLLGLPPEASMAIISGIFLNLYAAIAFAAPLDLTPYQWSILAIYLGVCHSLLVEGVIMKKIGISHRYSYSLRFFSALAIAYITTLLPMEWFSGTLTEGGFVKQTYTTLAELLVGSLESAVVLSAQIVVLITLLIFVMDFIKSRAFMQGSHKNVSAPFSLITGIFLGITYGAGVLIKETDGLTKYEIFYIGTFLMICHAIIEDTLLFVIFGADFSMVVAIRVVSATVLSYLLLVVYRRKEGEELQMAGN